MDPEFADTLQCILPNLAHQTSDRGSLSKDNDAEMMEMCGYYPKLVGHTHMFCFVFQISNLVLYFFSSRR